MDLSARTIISQALRTLGVLGEGVTVSGALAADALAILNEMIDAWNLERVMLFTSSRNAYDLTANDAIYTIGSGGDFNQTRPMWIDEARIIPDDTLATAQQTEEPCGILTLEEWAAKTLKNFTSTYPTELYYDKGLDSNDRGTITFWPVPTSANVRAVLYTPEVLTAFADLTTEYGFSRGYPRALRYNLAVELADEVGAAVTDRIEKGAKESKGLIATYNEIVPVLHCDPGVAVSGGYDIRSGRVR